MVVQSTRRIHSSLYATLTVLNMVSFLQGVYDTMTPRSQRNRNPQRIESDSSDDEAEAAGKKGARFFKVDERERELPDFSGICMESGDEN